MQTRWAVAPVSVGWLIAILVLVIDIVFMATGQIDLKLGLLLGGLAVARLV